MIEWLRLPEIQAIEAQFNAAAGGGHPASMLKQGVVSPNAVAIAGSDGHLFISDGANKWERQYLGQMVIDPSWTATWKMRLAARQVEAAALGVTLVNLVVPEKQVVYPEARWPAPLPDAQGRPLKHLLAQIDPGARLIYPEQELLAAKSASPIFRRHDSHWTTAGCAVVVARLLEVVSPAVRLADMPLAVERRRAAMDLSVHFFAPAPEEDYLVAVPPAEVLDDDNVKPTINGPGRNTGATYRLHNAAAPDPRRVVVFGDSYAFDAGLTAMLSLVFVEVVFLWSKDVVWDLITKRQADVVIWEQAERFMATVPAV